MADRSTGDGKVLQICESGVSLGVDSNPLDLGEEIVKQENQFGAATTGQPAPAVNAPADFE